ncbi:MAG: alpha/beta fold hydrolase [Solirubrobacteraceae bacterium]
MTAPPPPEPPIGMPPARTLNAPGRGELFMRDTGGEGPVVMLLHGWMVSADLNWYGAYGDLVDAGYRVLAIDHRGHGRGLRPLERFSLADCAADAAAALRGLGLAPATVVGYSMGGAIAQLVAHDHPDVVSGLVLSGTAPHYRDPRARRAWKVMGALRLMLSLAPAATWRAAFRAVGLRELGDLGPAELRRMAWFQSELMRQSARDVADAGRELGRFDSRPWLGSLRMPTAVVITTRDRTVPTSAQRELAAALGAPVLEVALDHLEIVSSAAVYNPALLEAIAAVRR